MLLLLRTLPSCQTHREGTLLVAMHDSAMLCTSGPRLNIAAGMNCFDHLINEEPIQDGWHSADRANGSRTGVSGYRFKVFVVAAFIDRKRYVLAAKHGTPDPAC